MSTKLTDVNYSNTKESREIQRDQKLSARSTRLRDTASSRPNPGLIHGDSKRLIRGRHHISASEFAESTLPKYMVCQWISPFFFRVVRPFSPFSCFCLWPIF